MNGTENATVISLPEIGMLGEKPFLTPKDVAILLGTTTTSIIGTYTKALSKLLN